MPKLVLKKGDFIVKKLYVPEDIMAFTVGSEQGNDIIIKDDSISYFHLQFEKQSMDYFIRDLQSQNGTFVNGNRINGRQLLNNNDEVELGNHRITFLYPKSAQNSTTEQVQPNRAAAATATGNSAFRLEDRISGVPSLTQLNSWLNDENDGHKNNNTFVAQKNGNHQTQVSQQQKPDHKSEGEPVAEFTPQPPKQKSEPVPPEPKPERNEPEEVSEPAPVGPKQTKTRPPQPEFESSFQESQPVAELEPQIENEITTHYLLGIYGYYTGRKFGIKHPTTRIGRDRKLNDIVIKKNSKGDLDQSVSRRQATISFKNNKYYLNDRRSKSRTWLNQTKLEKQDEVEINLGDEIEILGDKKSHIFRFVQEGEWDFSFPKKAGPWYVKNRVLALNIASVLLLAFALVMFGKSFMARSLAVQQPDPLQVEEIQWASAGLPANGVDKSEPRFTRFPAIADINGDRYLDLIFVDGENRLTCIDGKNDQQVWRNEEFEVIADFPVIVEDLYNNGNPDIVVVSKDLRVRALEGKWGIEIWRSPILAGPLTGSPVVSDFNNDGFEDVAIASAENAIFMGFTALENPRWLHMDLEQPIKAIMSATDLTGDGIANLLVGTETGQILFIDALNRRIVGTLNVNEELNKAMGRFDHNNQIRFPVALGDVNGDAVQDLVSGTVQGNLIVFNGENLKRLWYDTMSVTDSPNSVSRSGPNYAMGDLDGDNLMDVALLNHEKLRALKGLGQGKDRKMVLWQLPNVTGEEYIGYPVLADFNKNGTMDVLVACNRGKLFIFEGSTGITLWESDGSRSDIVSAPLVADLDNDSHLDIVVMRKDGRVYKLRTNTRVKQSAVLWGQIFGNSKNTNLANFIRYPLSDYNRTIATSAVLIVIVLGLQVYFRYKRQKLTQ